MRCAAIPLILTSIGLAAFSRATTMTYRYEGTLSAFADPIYLGQLAITDGSVAPPQLFSGTFTVNTQGFYPVTSVTLSLGRYAFASSDAAASEGPGAASIESYGLICPQIARPIPADDYNRIEIGIFASMAKLDDVFAARSASIGGTDLDGSSVLLQLLWRDLRNNPQSLQARGTIDRIEAVPEPSALAALSLGAVAFLKRRKKA